MTADGYSIGVNPVYLTISISTILEVYLTITRPSKMEVYHRQPFNGDLTII